MGEAQDIQVKPQWRFSAPRWIRNIGGFLWRHKFSVVFVAACVAAGTTAGVIHVREQIRQERIIEAHRQRWLLLKADLENVIRDFNGDAGIVVKDLSTSWEFTFNKYERFPAASLLKLPIMLALYEAAQQGKLNLSDTFHLTESCKVGGSGVLKTIPAGAQFTIDELIALMIDSSDNTATNILLGMLDFTYFNRWFETFGLQQTSLARKMMDFRNRKKGVENYTSAADIGYALEKLYRKEFINPGYSDKCRLTEGHLGPCVSREVKR